MLKSFKNLIFKSEDICLFCKENISGPHNYICSFCMELIEIRNKEVNLDTPYIDEIYYSCFYNRFIRDSIHGFKFEREPYLYKAFGEILLLTIEELRLDKKIDAIAFVPIHKKKEALRGYNQSELLATFVANNLDIPLLKNHLLKTKFTIDQNKLDKVERRNNLKNSFKAINIKDFKDKEILLIDDIITTGSTMEECAKILKESGAKSIYGLALTSGMRK